MKRTINKIIKSQKQEIMPGRFINAPLPSDEAGGVSPFILLHHFGPFEINYLNSFSFEAHPHRGFDAVTFLFEGEMQHRDSTGGYGRLKPGDVQWMTAGSGILHEESQPKDFLETGGLIHGIQLWVNLPKANKMTNPKYQDIRNEDIPVLKNNGVKERVIAGNYKNLTGPAKTFTPITAVHGIFSKGGKTKIDVPADFNACIYITKGSVKIDDKTALHADLVLFKNDGAEFEAEAIEDSEFLLLAGKPIDEPVVQYGPFVMSSMGEIKQAFLDYREGKFGNIN